MQLAVMLTGKLKGMGYEAACEFVAKRQLIPGSGKYLYSELRFLNPPTQCPDGDYVATFEPLTIAVKRRGGNWLIGRELPACAEGRTNSVFDPRRLPAPTLRALRLASNPSDPQVS